MKRRSESFFGLHLDLHPTNEDVNLGADLSEANIRKLIEEVNPDYITYDCKGHPGYAGYPTEVGVAAPNIQQDSLAMWRKVTKELDKPLAIHYSGVQDWIQVKNHPEWGVQSADGRTDAVTTSTFGEYVDKLLIPQLKELVDKYDINGVWLDGECWGAQLDYSPMAIQAWKEATGEKFPPTDPKDPHFEDYKNFNRQNFEKYLCHWTEEMHRYKKDLDCCSNWSYTTMMPKPKVAEVDMISGDFDPFLSVDRARTECRYLQNTGLPWELQSWAFDCIQDQDECVKMPDQIKQEAAVVMMHGGGYMNYYLPTRGGYINDQIINTAKEISKFCFARKEFSYQSTPVPQVAVLYPAENQLRRSDRLYAWWGHPLIEVEGVLHAMLESQYSCDVMAEHQIIDRMSDYPYIIIPECDFLSEDFIQKAVEYVKNGGNLFLCGLHCTRLFESYIGAAVGQSSYVNTSMVTPAGYKISARAEWAVPELSGAKTLIYRYQGEGNVCRSSYLDVRTEGVSAVTSQYIHRHPAITVNQLGKGKLAAAYADLASLYFNNHHPYIRDIFRTVAEEMFPNPAVRVESPYTVDISLRHTAEGKLCVHLMNTTNMPTGNRRSFTDYIPEVTDLKIAVKTENKPQKVMFEPDGIELPFTYHDAMVEVVLPKLHIHGAIVLE